jgi:uncharacterized protein YegP (UPF0339 family)
MKGFPMSNFAFKIKKNTETGQFHWILQATNSKTIAWSEDYEQKADCFHAMELVVKYARTSEIIDGTGEKPELLGRADKVFPPDHDAM